MSLLTTVLCLIGVAFAASSVVSDVAVNNGNCKYKNGYITENGVSRPATRAEERLIEEYQKEMKIWAQSLSSSITDEVHRKVNNALSSKSDSQTRVEGNKRPQAPKAPCLCSSATCESPSTNTSQRSSAYSNVQLSRQDQRNTQNSDIQYSKGRNNVNIIDYGNPAQNSKGVDLQRPVDNRGEKNYGYNNRAPGRTDAPKAYGRENRRNGNSNIQHNEGVNNEQSISK